jgi:hypothetical protein
VVSTVACRDRQWVKRAQGHWHGIAASWWLEVEMISDITSVSAAGVREACIYEQRQ